MSKVPVQKREAERRKQFDTVWGHELNDAFADIAPYYDRGNRIASLGLWSSFNHRFIRSIGLRTNDKVLDVCAGTHAVGMALLRREPTLVVYGVDRSAAMLAVGQKKAIAKGLAIHSLVSDAHQLPFPDNHFDLVTLQFASRHLQVSKVFAEVLRVLKPGGQFHHCDMLRPANPVVRTLYFAYLKACLSFTSLIVGSGPDATRFKQYFVDALDMFYTPGELSDLMRQSGYENVRHDVVFAGMIGYHHAAKPAPPDVVRPPL